MQNEIQFTINKKIKASSSEIFLAITTTSGYQGWWAAECDIDCTIGRTSAVFFRKPHILEEMRFVTMDVAENKRVVLTCTANNVFESMIGGVLTFEIASNNAGSELSFCQTLCGEMSRVELDSVKSGWAFFLNSLKKYCETGAGLPWG